MAAKKPAAKKVGKPAAKAAPARPARAAGTGKATTVLKGAKGVVVPTPAVVPPAAPPAKAAKGARAAAVATTLGKTQTLREFLDEAGWR